MAAGFLLQVNGKAAARADRVFVLRWELRGVFGITVVVKKVAIF